MSEFRKLFIKQHGFIICAVVLVLEIFLIRGQYIDNSENVTNSHYREYLTEYSGELTENKIEKILAERENIFNAQAEEQKLHQKLFDDEFTDASEFLEEMDKLTPVLERMNAFEMFYEDYNYAEEQPEKRYIAAGNFTGLCKDYPDVPMIIFTVLITAAAFLNEENSRMILFLRISSNGRKRAFFGKIGALFSALFFTQAGRVLIELSRLTEYSNEFSYPIQTLRYYEGCTFEISIFQGFVFIKLSEFFGILFICALTMLLSVTAKNAVPVVVSPCALCLLQQFMFPKSNAAFYLPTGFLRGAGFIRGNAFEIKNETERIQVAWEIPKNHIVCIVAFTAFFIAVSIFIGCVYYGNLRMKFPKKFAAVFTIASLCVNLCGCSNGKENKAVFNSFESGYFGENEDYYFICADGVTAISKRDGSKTELIHEEFKNALTPVFGVSTLDNELIISKFDKRNLYVGAVDPQTAEYKSVMSFEHQNDYGFLGLARNKPPFFGMRLRGIFTDGDDVYFQADGKNESGIYKLSGNKLQCVISGEIYNNMYSFDGANIYYINNRLELIKFNISNETSEIISSDLTRCVYYDGERLLYSNKKGIFERCGENENLLCDAYAERISSDNSDLVYLENGKLFSVLDDDKPRLLSENGNDFFTVLFDVDGVQSTCLTLCYDENGETIYEKIPLR